MRKLISVLALLAFAPALWAKVTIDYAKDLDFGSVKTFQFKPTDETAAQDPLLAERIVQMLKAKLTAAGLTEATSNPDVYVTYHVVTEDKPVLNTTGFGYGGYAPGWGAWGGGLTSTTTTVSTFTEDTLVIDAYRPSDNRLVWRGQGTTSWSEKPDKRDKQIEDTLDDLSARWQKILRNQGE
jgi:Domain of unknown function (DUF4136)